MSHWEPAVVNLTVDLVVLTVRQEALHVLVVERGVEPYLGQLALPGGFVQADEDIPLAAARELEEETHIRPGPLHLEQLGTYAKPGRDPRGRIVTVAYLAIAPDLPLPKGDSDAAEAAWTPVGDLVSADQSHLAFDHDEILRDGVERARSKLEYTTLATAFCPATFTLSELRRVYEVVWGVSLDPRNFQRKVLGTAGFVKPTDQLRRQEAGRPARLFARGEATLLYPSILRAH